MSGFIALHREAREHPLFAGNAERFGAWFWMVASACWKPTRFSVGGSTIMLERGQLCASRAQLSTAWGMSPSGVERFLTRLEAEQMIGRATGQGRSIITICNYDKYQDVSDEPGQATGQARGQADTRTGGRSKTGQATGQPFVDANHENNDIFLENEETPGQGFGQQSDSDRTTKEQYNKGTIEEEAKASPSRDAGASDAGEDLFDKPNPATKTKRTRKAPKPLPDVVLPDWIPIEAWNGFIEMRVEKGAVPTARAMKLLVEKLSEFRSKGHDPTAVLNKSTTNNWTDLYEPKEIPNGNRSSPARSGASQSPGRGGGQPLAAGFQRRAFEAQSRRAAEEAERQDAGPFGGDDGLPYPAARALPRA